MQQPSVEAVKTAIKSKWDPRNPTDPPYLWSLTGCPGWITNGHFACRGDEPKTYGPVDKLRGPGDAEAMKKTMASWIAAATDAPVVRELPELGVAHIEEKPERRSSEPVKCHICDGEGDHDCDGCGHNHDCARCGGDGEIKGTLVEPKVLGVTGRVVYSDGRIKVVIDPRFKGLLDGLVVKRGSDPAEPVYGCDPETKELVIVVMPIIDHEINP
jgi:hypothetical protein